MAKRHLTLRIRQELRAKLERFAEVENRDLSNLTELLLEWGFEQLKAAGSTDQLLKFNLGKRQESKD